MTVYIEVQQKRPQLKIVDCREGCTETLPVEGR